MLSVVPITLREANAFVEQHHRHAGRVQGHRFAIAASAEGQIVGVCCVGRPIARAFDDGWTAEVNRCCVMADAPKNTASFLYGRAWRIWQAMGGRALVTYTLATESGASLRGAGWRLLGSRQGRDDSGCWNSIDRKRQHRPIYEADKLLWAAR